MARTGGIRGLGSDEAVWTKLIHLALFKDLHLDLFRRFLISFCYLHRSWSKPKISTKMP